MKAFRMSTLVCVAALAGCAVAADRDDLASTEQSLTPKVEVAWTEQFGTDKFEQVNAATAIGGAVYVTGSTAGPLVPPQQQGQIDGFLRKYDAKGTIVWTRQFGPNDENESLAIAADTTGVYVGGYTGSSPSYGFVRKFDHDGNQLWAQLVAPDTGSVKGLAVDATGLYIVGQTNGAYIGQTNAGGFDAFVLKYELTGNGLIWVRQFGTAEGDSASAVFVDGTGVYVAGQTNGALAGSNLGNQDAFLRKYDLNGDPASDPPTRQFGTASYDAALAITGDASGIYVSGTSATVGAARDGFLRKFDRNLGELWTRAVVGGDDTVPSGLAADGSGVLVGGFTDGAFSGFENQGETDVFVRKIDPRGRNVWTFQTGTAARDEAHALAFDANGIFVAGGTYGDFGAANVGISDAFVFELVPFAPKTTRRK